MLRARSPRFIELALLGEKHEGTTGMLAVDHLALRLGDFVQRSAHVDGARAPTFPGGPRNRRTQCVIDFAYAWCVAE